MAQSLHVQLAEDLAPQQRAGLAEVVALFQRMLDDGLHPGAQLAVFQHGRSLLEVAGGRSFAGGAPVTPRTLFQMRSITKLLATLVTLRSLERGHFQLDDPVARYWPEFGANGKAGITVRQVMAHRAGIPDGPPLAPPQLHDRDLVRAAIEALQPVWVPGTENGYHAHTIGWVLQELVRVWEGQPLEVLLRREILEPLGIDDLYLGLPESEFPRMAKMTVEDVVRAGTPRRAAMSDFINSYDGVRLPLSSVMGVATAPALARLMSMVALGGAAHGQRIVATATLALAAVPTNAAGYRDLRLDHPIRWGLGFIVGNTPDIYGTPSRPRRIGHAGGGANVAWADPDSGVAVAFLSNRMLAREASWARCRIVSDAVDAALGGGADLSN